MSQDERQITPGDIIEGIGEWMGGDGAMPGKAVSGAYPGVAGTALTETALPGYQWQNVPYAPPFSVPAGATYPHLCQVPWSYFPGFPYRPEEGYGMESDGAEDRAQTAGGSYEDETRQLFPFFGFPPFGPQFGFGFGFPFFRPIYRPFYPYYPRPYWWY
ncbi:hypothetical protein [Effusibacillus lacus]|uniref:Uncharacterized protein n=1 Tax=Effusibacillus lacus TaxID=1348429 RepID=A0A292YSY3_9BACL|nr:hypothetical protein [Effusibacillus lacus]TCS74924.1 hypothetical protein EDD64_11048 [Effusibacillus lacus]GAX91595.1 hypothetical protein EFBL_3285 [Effusibacillus lacus]